MIYVTLAGIGLIPWHPGWLIVPLSVIADLGLILGKVLEQNSLANTGATE